MPYLTMKISSNFFSNFAIVLLYFLTTSLIFVEHVSCHSVEQEKSQTNYSSIKNKFSYSSQYSYRNVENQNYFTYCMRSVQAKVHF